MSDDGTNTYTEELNREFALRVHDRQHEIASRMREAAVQSANTAIRSLTLVNGGAVVALLAFTGALETGSDPVSASELVSPIWWFAFGVALAASTALAAYLVNMCDSDIVSSRTHTWKHPYVEETTLSSRLGKFRGFFFITAICLALGSLVSFFCGIWFVTSAISALGI